MNSTYEEHTVSRMSSACLSLNLHLTSANVDSGCGHICLIPEGSLLPSILLTSLLFFVVLLFMLCAEWARPSPFSGHGLVPWSSSQMLRIQPQTRGQSLETRLWCCLPYEPTLNLEKNEDCKQDFTPSYLVLPEEPKAPGACSHS